MAENKQVVTNNKAEILVKKMLEHIGENSDREGLVDTPKRVVKMWSELFSGYYGPPPNITMFNNGNDGIIYDEMISDEGPFISHCEHHMVPFMGHYWFAYLPHTKGKILGLSKVARIVDYFSARLQIQERLTHQIIQHIWESMCDDKVCKNKPLGMGLVLEAEHLCKTMRGVKKQGKMRTTKLLGVFKTDGIVRNEFMDWVNK